MRALGQLLLSFTLLAVLMNCGASSREATRASGNPREEARQPSETNAKIVRQNPGKLVHVLVALCDNENQGIVPVSAALGNGEDPERNLYWGAAFGIKTFFTKSKEWQLVSKTIDPKYAVMERLVFKHRSKNVYLVADAYKGIEIQRAIADFLASASGNLNEAIEVSMAAKNLKLQIGGGADLLAFVGHNGLMDFSLPEYPKKQDDALREAIILSCASKSYFTAPLKLTGAQPLLWTTNLMAPEAYILKSALDGWILGEDGERIRQRAAEAYHSYQKCGLKAARTLFASGW
jgi:hypothetical protein